MSTRRTIATVALALTAPFALSACGTSFGAQTNQQYQASEGSDLRTGPVHVYNGLLVDNGDGTATFSGGLLATEEQTIEAVSLEGDAKKLPRPITVKPNQLLTLGAEGEIVVKLFEVTAGDYVTISFAATPGGDASIDVPIVARDSMYDSVAKRPKPGATATPQEDETDPAEPEDLGGQDDTSPGA
ncbi:hypothetical protein [Aeromicrobium duanguangcaii]|uniref:hypothetical protein n=1 Tax=Aeromicrobium duanguangcaii TaxID=2968086 RepID=UPI00201794D3|nr:hypothetical protein [Aeromicrobium duanguangcaii]MCL3838535.1 hypothetical protein [Aeromicrobium duanguangcaii]